MYVYLGNNSVRLFRGNLKNVQLMEVGLHILIGRHVRKRVEKEHRQDPEPAPIHLQLTEEHLAQDLYHKAGPATPNIVKVCSKIGSTLTHDI